MTSPIFNAIISFALAVSLGACYCNPQYDCTNISPEKQKAFDDAIKGCEQADARDRCSYRIRQAYCKPVSSADDAKVSQ